MNVFVLQSLVGRAAISVLPALLALLGAGMLYRTYQGRERAAAIEGTPKTAVSDLEPGEGTVRVDGEVRTVDGETTEATMLGTGGVAVRTTVEERGRTPGSQSTDAPQTTQFSEIHASTEAVPFRVDDGTGTVRVEVPDGGTAALETQSATAEPGEAPPEPVVEWYRTADHDLSPEREEYRHYQQGVVEPGDEVVVLGEVVRADGGEPLLTGGSDPDAFALSDGSAEELAEGESYSLAGYAVGAVLFLLGAVPLGFLWLG